MSSTLQELAAERRTARAAIEDLRFTPVMFELGARPHAPQALYRAYLEQSDVFVGLYWQRYGWVAPGMEISGLEDEYLLAADLPKLVYVKRSDEREPELVALLERIAADRVSYRYFEREEELGTLLADDLALLVSERFVQAHSAGVRLAPLPAPVSSFVGREPEIESVVDLLGRDEIRLLTLTGPGGIGKTRLSLEAGRRVSGHFRDGVAFVPLATISTRDDVAPAIAGALGLDVDSDAPLVDALCERLAPLELLLVLDNLEHVVAAASIVGRLLEAAPGLTVLATSRVRLDVGGEHLFHVPPLSLPGESEREVEAIKRADAVRLFAARAEAAGWTTSDADVPLLADIVRRLDGLPLAIELAAAQARLVPAELIHTRLRRRLDLAGGPRDAEERHRTLRSTIAWSYDLLDEPAKRFFEVLSVCVGGFSLEAAAALADPDQDVEGLLASLVDASLVTTGPSAATGVRFGMLDTIREYASERLDERAGRAQAARDHLAYFAALADEAYDAPIDQLLAAHLRQDEERENLRAALRDALRTSPVEGVRLAGALEHLWSSRGLAREGRDAITRALAAAPDTPAPWRARALLTAAWLAAEHGEYAEAEQQALESLELFRALGDARNVGESLNALGWSADRRGDAEIAVRYFEESYRVYSELSDESLRVLTAIHLARWLQARGDLDEARRLYAEALDRLETHGLEDGCVSVLLHLGEIDQQSGDHDSAHRFYEECRDLARRIGNTRVLASALVGLAAIDADAGRVTDAGSSFAEALDLQLELGDRTGAAYSLERLAAVALSCGEPEATARLLGAAGARRVGAGEGPPLAEAAEAAEVEQVAVATLGEERFEREAAVGAALGRADLLTLVDSALSAPDRGS